MKVCGDCEHVVTGTADCHCGAHNGRPVGYLKEACKDYKDKESVDSQCTEKVAERPCAAKCKESGCKYLSRANYTSQCGARRRSIGTKSYPVSLTKLIKCPLKKY